MKFLIILFISFHFLSCHPPEVEGDGDVSAFALVGQEGDVHEMNHNNSNEVDIFNFNKTSVYVVDRGFGKDIKMICRSMDGCLRACEHLSRKHCRKLAVDEVVRLWLSAISTYQEWEQALKDLTLIATDPAIAEFLKHTDKGNRVLAKLFHQSTWAHCPQRADSSTEIQISASRTSPPSFSLFLSDLSVDATTASAVVPAEPVSPKASSADRIDTKSAIEEHNQAVPIQDSVSDLQFLGVDSTGDVGLGDSQAVGQGEAQQDSEAETKATAKPVGTEAQVAGLTKAKVKKIVDGSRVPFNYLIFHSFIKQCFGHQTKTFSEMSAQIENKPAFELAHKLISKTCGGNADCVRLAYCSISNDLVWANLPEDVQKAGCAFDSFSDTM